jgi:hypothetical protein
MSVTKLVSRRFVERHLPERHLVEKHLTERHLPDKINVTAITVSFGLLTFDRDDNSQLVDHSLCILCRRNASRPNYLRSNDVAPA